MTKFKVRPPQRPVQRELNGVVYVTDNEIRQRMDRLAGRYFGTNSAEALKQIAQGKLRGTAVAEQLTMLNLWLKL